MSEIVDESTARAFVAERCDENSFARLESFTRALARANQHQNLVSAGSLPFVWQRHIADSAQLLDHVSRETGLWLDLGSGAGLPGLVIAIMRPELDVVLIESRNLRIAWLREIIEQLSLDNCRVVGSDIRRAPALAADVISARAFAPMPRLIALSARFSTKATEWVLPKGRSAAQEVAELPADTRRMFHVEQSLTDAEAGIILGKGRIEARA